MTNVVEQFADLFEGRTDAYGTEEGGCMRVENDWRFEQLWARHLSGEWPIGVYPMVHSPLEEWAPRAAAARDGGNALPFRDGWYVKWGCVDFDVKTKGKPSWDYESETDAHVAAVNLQRVLTKLSVTSWIERTRSCGRHVWVFADGWCPSSTMRRSLLVACSVAGVSSREVNPKQETLSEGQLGNYVRLPYPGANSPAAGSWFPAQRTMVSEPDIAISFPKFVHLAHEARTSPKTLERIAALYKEPEKRKVVIERPDPRNCDFPSLRALNSAAYTIWRDGPTDGDRSRGMAYLAYQCRLSGLTESQTYNVLQSATWNKFAGRPDEDIRLQELVIGAWQ